MEVHSSRHPSYPTAIVATPLRTTSLNASCDKQDLDGPLTRPPAKPNLRDVLKTILLKDYYKKPDHDSSPGPDISSGRPPMMRMKDSEDYITARGANPRTGLISPSVGTRTPCTPNSPGDALKLRKVVHVSPTPVAVVGTPSRANEGRKISGGDAHGWPAQEAALFMDKRSLTPPIDGIYSDAASQCSVPKDDQLLHMPSACEPQPFAYPGYSEQQIQAFEHYKHKATRTSSEGYDRRLIRPSAKLMSTPGAFESYDTPDNDEELWIVHPVAGQQFQPYRQRELHEVPSHRHYDKISVRKRDNAGTVKQLHEIDRAYVISSEAKTPIPGATALLSPTSVPPKTRAIDKLAEEEDRGAPKEACRRNDFRLHTQQEICCSATAQIARKAIGSAPRPTPVAKDDHYRQEYRKQVSPSFSPEMERSMSGELLVEDLKLLPRVRRVRETHSAGGRRRDHERQCSFGCQQNTGDGQRLERRKGSTGTVIRRKSYVDDESETTPLADPQSAEIALGILYTSLAYLQGIRVPKSAQIETLMSSSASTKEKAEALRAVLSVSAHAVACCTILAMLWKLGVATLHLLEVLLWPLAVPLKILRWIASTG